MSGTQKEELRNRLYQRSSPLESRLKDKVRKELKKIQKTEDLEYIIVEAGAVRGIPDVLICFRGKFVAWELKKSKSELYYKNGEMKLKGRTVLQWVRIQKLRQSGGIAHFVYPENFKEKLGELLSV